MLWQPGDALSRDYIVIDHDEVVGVTLSGVGDYLTSGNVDSNLVDMKIRVPPEVRTTPEHPGYRGRLEALASGHDAHPHIHQSTL
jgi:hypothetical protein